MDRNVCRCGTYPRIVEAIKLAASACGAGTRLREAGDERRAPCRSTTVEVERYELTAAAPLQVRGGAARLPAHLRALGGGLLVVVAGRAHRRAGVRPRRPAADGAARRLAPGCTSTRRGSVTAYTGKTEIGQNIRTSLAQAIADELRVPLEPR